MTKTIAAPLQTHLDGTSTTLAWLWKITRQDGQVFGFTNSDRDIVANIDGLGNVTYVAKTGMSPTEIRNTSSMAVDNLSVESRFDSEAITEADLEVGKWDYAEVKIALVNHQDPSQGQVRMRVGNVGEISYDKRAFKGELRGLVQRFSQKIGELTSPLCRAELGDTRCGVQLSPQTWTATTEFKGIQTGINVGRDAKLGTVVKPATFNDRFFRLITEGFTGVSEPTWDTTIGNTTTESLVSIPDWAATTAYSAGDVVRPTTPNGFLAVAENAGTSDASEPTWPTTDEQTVLDNDITWRMQPDVAAQWVAEEALTVETQVLSQRSDDLALLVVDYSGSTSGADMENGRIRFNDPGLGAYDGTVWEVRSFDDTTGLLTLFLPTPTPLTFPTSVSTDPNFANVTLMVSARAGEIADYSPLQRTLTPIGTFFQSNQQSNFADGFSFINNTDQDVSSGEDYLLTDNSGLAASTIFTLELWAWARVFHGTASDPVSALISSVGTRNNSSEWSLGTNFNQSERIEFRLRDGFSDVVIISDNPMPLNTWTHIAIDRDGANNLRMYINGVVQASTVVVARTVIQHTFDIGAGSIGADERDWDGHLDEIRYTDGVARYAGSGFTAPGRFSVTGAPQPVSAELIQGCNKTRSACKRFDNILNMRAELYLPGNDAILQTPNART